MIYYAAAIGRFQIFDYRERPGEGSWVVTEVRDDQTAIIAPFRGQTFIAVVRWLELYPLVQSEQTFPREEAPKPKKTRKRVYWPRRLAC